ncbi:unnamed protein product [Linum tenue]|uniref:Potassium transporter n=1 Tax=Linum tenue TaxID=586396 RepID=A0AAV0JMG6_9ROSI|nr:unnamed protein product [Linum tenue]
MAEEQPPTALPLSDTGSEAAAEPRSMIDSDDECTRPSRQHEQQLPTRTKNLFDIEASGGGDVPARAADWGTIMRLAFQCIGVVYGDLGTSPLYVLPGIFPDGIKHMDDLLGVMSLIIYSILFIPLLKYVLIVLSANDNGEDQNVSNYNLPTPNRRNQRASALKSALETSKPTKCLLLLMTMLGVSMLIGDGILTPVISVLSAVSGVKQATAALDDAAVMWISVAILVLLFQFQRFGTDKVGYTFAPFLVLWFFFLAAIGIYNFVRYDPAVALGFNPWYIVRYFERNGKRAWASLGGVVLCLTGAEALFADLGHFHIRSIQISACSVLIPSILLAYLGQCSYLRVHPQDVATVFYSSIPDCKPLYWSQFVVAVLAAVIASQAIISASFSIVQQAMAMGCFPRVKVVHTSAKYEGQVYIPEINTFLMLACVAVTLGFKNTVKIGNAYGIAVAMVFVLTSCFMILIMVLIWKTHFALILLYCLTIGLIELAFLSSVLYKFDQGGYLPLAFALILVSIMLVWSYGYHKKYSYELQNKVSPDQLARIVTDPRILHVRGLGLFYTQLVQGVSPVFTHYVARVPVLHSVLVFVSIKFLPISRVPLEERFVFEEAFKSERQLIFRCVVRYGYKDARKKEDGFEGMLVRRLKEFIETSTVRDDVDEGVLEGDGVMEVGRQIGMVDEAIRVGGVVYVLGESQITAAAATGGEEGRKGWRLYMKKVTLGCLYNWLSRCVRQPDEVFMIPRQSLLKVGITYEV